MAATGMEALLTRGPDNCPDEAGARRVRQRGRRRPDPVAAHRRQLARRTRRAWRRSTTATAPAPRPPSVRRSPGSSSASSPPARRCRTAARTAEDVGPAAAHPLHGRPRRGRLPDEHRGPRTAGRPGVPRRRGRGHPRRREAPLPARQGRPADRHVHVRRRARATRWPRADLRYLPLTAKSAALGCPCERVPFRSAQTGRKLRFRGGDGDAVRAAARAPPRRLPST